MARVPRRATSAQAPLARSGAAKVKSRKHKIVMESVTQAKKKLRSVISFEAKAPPGYTFIPAGNPQLTNACKEACRKEGHKVFAVSTTPHQRMHNLSQQVHRIGYHFPSVVVAASCMELGVFLSTMGKVMTYQETHPHGGYSNFDRKMRADSEVSQTTINTEARDAIKDLFPNIPDKDLNQIIKTAFQKGQRKVGTASELPLARRAQLAVVAHIRHVYTQYDRLLRLTSFQEARASVEEPTLAKLVQWRGDDENGKTVLEDVFREVIVISDDEDDDDSVIEEDINVTGGNRDSSIEVVSSNALVGELDMLPVNYSNLETTNNNATRDLSGDEAPTGFRFVPGTHRRDHTRKKNPDRRGFNRYQAWDRARDRYRDGGYVADYGSISRHAIDDPVSRTVPGSGLPPPSRSRPDHMGGIRLNRVNSPNNFPTHLVDTRHETRGQLERLRHDNTIQANPHNSHPAISRQTEPIEAPDRVFFAPVPRPSFERIPAPGLSDSRYIPISRDAPPTRKLPSQVRSHATTNRAYHPVDYPDEHRVYPSIETPQSPPRRETVNHPDERNYHTTSDDHRRQPQTPPPRPIDDLSRQVKVIGIDDGQRDQSLYKRRRVEYKSPPRGDIPASSRVNEVRPVMQTPEKPREPQYISLISPASGRGSDRIQPRFGDERSSLQEFTPAGRQLETHPVGRAPSLIPVPHNTGFSGSFDRQSGHNYRAPISLHHSRHASDASLNSFKPPPAPVSYRESGYMVRDDGHAVRSNQIPNVAERRSQFVDHAVRQASEVPMVPRDQPLREGPQPLVMKENGPVRHHYISNQGLQKEGERPLEFAKPVHLRGREAAPHHDIRRFLPEDRQPGDIPFHRAERDPHADQASYREPNRPVPGTHLHRYPSSPKHAYPHTQVPVSGQHRLIRIGPGSASHDTDGFIVHSPTSVPRDGRGRVPLDNGRYAYRTAFD